MKKKTKLFLLTGFLGSGKTTLLAKLISEQQGDDHCIAVLINEAGALNFDGKKLPKTVKQKELLNGCMCCSVQGQVAPILLDLLQEERYETIFIEASGVAHPLDVLDGCLTPEISALASSPTVINLVDGPRFAADEPKAIKLKKLILAQIRHADINILNKYDLLSENQLEDIKHSILIQNKTSPIIPATFGQLEAEFPLLFKRSSPINATKTADVEQLQVTTFVYQFARPIQEKPFKEWLYKISKDVYRIKGYIPFKEYPSLTEVQVSFGEPEYSPTVPNNQPILVFIGQHLNHDSLNKKLKSFEKGEPVFFE